MMISLRYPRKLFWKSRVLRCFFRHRASNSFFALEIHSYRPTRVLTECVCFRSGFLCRCRPQDRI